MEGRAADHGTEGGPGNAQREPAPIDALADPDRPAPRKPLVYNTPARMLIDHLAHGDEIDDFIEGFPEVRREDAEDVLRLLRDHLGALARPIDGGTAEEAMAKGDGARGGAAGPLSRSPDVMHGQTVFAGTRVPAWIMLDYLGSGETLDTFLAHYPTVRRERALDAVRAAWAAPGTVPPLAGADRRGPREEG